MNMEKSEDVDEKTRVREHFDVETVFHSSQNIEEKTYIPKKLGRRLNLYVTAVAVNILSFLAGVVYGWPSTMLAVLQGADSPVGLISDMDASWLASMVYLTRLLTVPFYMYTIDHYGRRNTGYLVATPFIVGNVMLTVIDSVALLYCARFVLAVAAGGACILVPAYISDIAEDANKGRLGTMFGVALSLGLTFTYTAGYYASYIVYHYSCVAMAAACLIVLRWLPESPLYLATAGQHDEARDALCWLRDGDDCEIELERTRIRARELLQTNNHKVSMAELMDRATIRAFVIVLGLIVNQQLTGNAPVLVYTVSIFEAAGSTIPPNICSIIVGVLTTIGTLVSSAVIERCGRRPLLIASDAIFVVCLGALGTYFYLHHLGLDLSHVSWLPLAALSVYVFTLGLGFASLPFTIVTEMVRPQARGTIQTTLLMFLSAFVFIVLFCFVPAARALGQYACFWFFAAACGISAICLYFAMPETKNRSLEAVVAQLGGPGYVRSVLAYGRKP